MILNDISNAALSLVVDDILRLIARSSIIALARF